MENNEKKCCEFLSSLKYTNILLTIIALVLVGGAICKHAYIMNKKHSCSMDDKGMMMGEKGMMECPAGAPRIPATKK